MKWSIEEILSLYMYRKLTNADKVQLVEQCASLDEALQTVGAIPLDHSDVHRWTDECAKNNVSIVTLWDSNYPLRLKQIESPPPIIFVAGTLPPSELPFVAVVGTRSCTAQYGKPATDLVVNEWTKAGCVIVSGLANGIDTLAHQACLRGGGKTIAVIASGIGRITPVLAQHLANTIVDKDGAVISEHPYNVAALPPYFPSRNRIISGLSDAVVVVESKATGGALITVDFAIKQGRQVWSVPGPITSSRSIGTNMLIQSGKGLPLCAPEDLLKALNINAQENKPARLLPAQLEMLGPDILHIDSIASKWNCTTQAAMQVLLEFELEGMVEQLPGGHYRNR